MACAMDRVRGNRSISEGREQTRGEEQNQGGGRRMHHAGTGTQRQHDLCLQTFSLTVSLCQKRASLPFPSATPYYGYKPRRGGIALPFPSLPFSSRLLAPNLAVAGRRKKKLVSWAAGGNRHGMKEAVAAGGGGNAGVSPCAACKLLRRRCSPGCVFAPYFPAGEPHRFASVHKVFGASNVSKLLQEIPAEHRGDAVSSLVYEANARVRDPIYGCVGAITSLQRQVESLQTQLALAQAEMVRLRMANAYGTGSSAGGSSPTKPTPDHHHHHHHHHMAAVDQPGVMELELDCSRFWSF